MLATRRPVRLCLFATLPMIAALSWPAAEAADPHVAPSALPPVLSEPYTINVGDELEVTFFKTIEFNRTMTVGPDGDVYMPLIGRVRAVDRTLEDLNDELTRRYGRELVQPQINIRVSKFSGLRIYVGGEVNEPGMIPYRGGFTVTQAIMEAGGFNTTARLKSVLLIRRGPGDEVTGSIINLRKVLKKGLFNRDIELAPADVLFVPRSKIANVNLFIEQYLKNILPIPDGIGIAVDINN